jgi:hypothetical protein
MAIAFVGGDKVVVNKEYVTAAQNLCDKSLVCITGSAPAAAAGGTWGVVEKDTKSGNLATVKNGIGSILEVLATSTVTAGSRVEAYVVSTYANIDGTSTAVTTCAGVMDLASGFPVGIAHTGSDAGGTVLVEFNPFVPKGAIA